MKPMTHSDPQACITELKAQNAALREALVAAKKHITRTWPFGPNTGAESKLLPVINAALAIGGNDESA